MLSEQYSIRELQPTCVPKGYRSAIAMSAIWHASRYLTHARMVLVNYTGLGYPPRKQI